MYYSRSLSQHCPSFVITFLFHLSHSINCGNFCNKEMTFQSLISKQTPHNNRPCEMKRRKWSNVFEIFPHLVPLIPFSFFLTLCQNPNMSLPAERLACQGKLMGLKWLNEPVG